MDLLASQQRKKTQIQEEKKKISLPSPLEKIPFHYPRKRIPTLKKNLTKTLKIPVTKKKSCSVLIRPKWFPFCRGND